MCGVAGDVSCTAVAEGEVTAALCSRVVIYGSESCFYLDISLAMCPQIYLCAGTIATQLSFICFARLDGSLVVRSFIILSLRYALGGCCVCFCMVCPHACHQGNSEASEASEASVCYFPEPVSSTLLCLCFYHRQALLVVL